MGVRAARLRAPEWALGLVSVALMVVLFGLRWYRHGGVETNGWGGLTVLGPLTAVAAALGIAIWVLQATRSAPALPVALVLVDLALGLILAVGLMVRVLIDPPSVAMLGAYLGLALAVLSVLAAYASLRRDGVAEGDAPQWVETLAV